MSESQPGAGRYPRTSGGLIASLVVTVLAVIAFAGFRALTGDTPSTPIPAVDYQTWVKAGRADDKLAVFVPTPLPKGWKATSASYDTGSSPAWHLGMLTAAKKYVGIEESEAAAEDLVQQYVDPDAVQGKDVQIGGQTWQTWTDAGGDYGLVRRLTGPDGRPESVLVVGSAPPSQVRDVVASLREGA